MAEQMTELASAPAPEGTLGEAAAPSSWLPARSGRRRALWWTVGALALLLTGLAASWLALPIKQVSVTGNRQLSAEEVKRLAGITPTSGWLYYGKGRASGLLKNPWVQSAVITRRFPDSVSVEVVEREPFLQMLSREGKKVLIAQDGRLLPWKAGFEGLPMVSGWGPERLADCVLVARALSRYTVQSVAYTPSGLTVKTAAGTVWSGDLKSLLKYAGSISMYPNQKINIYPWGVSVQ